MKFSRFCTAVVLMILAVIMAYMVVVSMTETVDMNMNNRMLENVETKEDSFLFNLLTMAGLALVTAAWIALSDRIPAWLTVTLCTAGVTALGVIFILSSQSAPTHDSLIVSRAAYQASIGNGEGLAAVYFKQFPFQLGYVKFSECFIRLFGTGENYLVMEFVNVACLAVTYLSILLTVRNIFGEGRVLNVCALLMILFCQPILFCSFTYGNIPGLMFAVLAVRQVLALRHHRLWANLIRVLLAAIFIGCGVAVKKNVMIIFAALVILLIIRFIRKPSATDLLCLALCLFSVWAIPAGVQKHYEARFDLEFGKGIPMISWAAMGLNESYIAPGWYSSGYTVVNFRENGMDPEKAAKASEEVIRERISYFRSDPGYTLHFFSQKIRSEWNEPTYQSIWTNQVRGRYGEMGKLASWICGNGEKIAKQYMNAVVQFLFLLSTAGALSLLGKRRIEEAFFSICVVGGFLYHAIFEAKSQYILVYMILLLPIAAKGAEWLFRFLPGKKNKIVLLVSGKTVIRIDGKKARRVPVRRS